MIFADYRLMPTFRSIKISLNFFSERAAGLACLQLPLALRQGIRLEIYTDLDITPNF